MKSLADFCFAIVDLETTGTRATRDKITEVALIEIEQFTVTESWQQLIDPQTHLPEYIEQLTGISNHQLKGKPAFEEVADMLFAMLDKRILIAHNARFDYAFLRNSFKRLDIDYSPKILCTVKLSRWLNPQFPTHKLDFLIEHYGLYCQQRHRAMHDALALWELLKCWIEQHGVEKVLTGIEQVMKRPAMPVHLTAKDFDKLPDKPGVYLFYGDKNIPLYIGKSIHIKTRVMSHFSADHSNNKEMEIARQVKQIDFQRTAGDLGAQLLESKLIKQLQPIYNHRLRRQSLLCYFLLTQDKDGFYTFKLKQSKTLPTTNSSKIIGLFRSKHAAEEKLREWSVIHGLCPQKLGMEKARKGACFAYQLKKCNGACCGKESQADYNQRILDIINDWEMKVWPYSGAIWIEEAGDDFTQFHLVNQWSHLSTQDTLTMPSKKPSNIEFDYDTYKILCRSLHQFTIHEVFN